MKVAIICPVCGKAKRESETYLVKIKDFRPEKLLDGKPFEYKSRVCRTDARRMGYKIKTVKKNAPHGASRS